MESVSRPPHRRKVSSSSSSVKNPYEDVLITKRSGKFGAQEYAEIFSGSSSIPVLDLSGLENRVGLSEVKSSDYSNIFGGLGNDDVAVPYEDLFRSNATKRRFPSDASSASQKSGPLPPSGRTKRSSGEVSDQSADAAKQQFNLSFNKTTQNSVEESNGKTHVTELHAVPGFTYFVDGSTQPQKKTGDGKPVQSLKREVSRTWSFSADVEAIKGKGGVNWDKIHTPEKLRSVNEFNLKSQPSKAPPMQSTSSSHASKKDAFGKISGENSPSLLDEELDENSVAAVSAAALKKAIEQAQESIRIAKLIMERKGLQVGTIPRSKNGMRVKDKKKTRVDHVATDYPKEENAQENCERSDPIFTGVDGKFVPSFSNIDPPVNAGKVEVKKVTSNVEIAKGHGEAFSGLDKKVDLENKMESVEVLEVSKEGTDYPGLASNTESKDPNLMSRLVGNISSMLFGNKPASSVQETETGKGNAEQMEKTLHHEKRHEDVADLGNSIAKQDTKSVPGSPAHSQPIFDESEEPENVNEVVARDFDASHVFQDEGRIMKEEDEMLRSRQEDQSTEENERATGDAEACDNSVQQSEEMVKWSTVEKEELELEEVKNNTECVDERKKNYHRHEGSFDVEETMTTQIQPHHVESDTKEVKNDTECVDKCRENYHIHGGSFDVEETMTTHIEPHHDFDSDAQPKEGTEEEEINMKEPEIISQIEDAEKRENLSHELEIDEEINHVNEKEPGIIPEIEVEKRDNLAHELEIDEKNNHANDGDVQKSPGELEQLEKKEINTFENEVVDTIEVKADNAVEVEYSDVFWDAEKMNNSSGEEERNEFGEAVYDKDIDEAVDARSSDASTVSSENQQTHMSTVFSETKEACGVELNDRTEEYQKECTSYEENVAVQGVLETVSGIDEDTIEVKADNAVEVEYSDVFWDAEKMNNSSGEEERNEFGEAVYDKDIDEAVDTRSSDASTVSSENQQTHMSTVFSVTKEACGVELNDRTEEYQKECTSYEENVAVQGVLETVSGIDEDKDADVESVSNEGLSFDNVNADNAEKLTKDQHSFETAGEKHGAGDVSASEIQTLPNFQPADNKTAGVDLHIRQVVCGQILGSDKESVLTSSVDNVDGLSAQESQEGEEVLNNKTSDYDEIKDDIEATLKERKHVDKQGVAVNFESNNEIKDMGKSLETERVAVTCQNTETNKENPTKAQKKDSKDNFQNFDKAEHQQRIEAIKKGREREKDRMAVERAIREARERAFAEARERAERAAVERAAAEARQRAMAEAREKLDKASNEAKIRAERAAVERATAEARERALEKAKTQIDRSAPEKSTSSSRNNGLKHSFSSSDIAAVEGTSTESAQRTKARLERHQRIMERAAKALEEKNMRDLVAQKEQAERNRLAESLDAEIKRWAAGKEGNLRALLSTLQYILGSSSGWQPISLTEIITTPAVKKAYRKATLYVHPDKLQQRGASIQQKYICEKVFDLLKAAWNRFNSEER